jgi:hypothetical protein
MGNNHDVAILRELAKQVAEIAAKDIQDERRELWRAHNNSERVRPPVLMRGGYERELLRSITLCEDQFYRWHEIGLRARILIDMFGDDNIIEPWITQRAAFRIPDDEIWGVKFIRENAGGDSIGFHMAPALPSFDDMESMRTPSHEIDEARTSELAERLHDAVGDILQIHVNRAPQWSDWAADISTHLGYLRGHEQMFYDMRDNPDELHRLLAFMRDGVLKAQGEAELAGDWSLCEHANQVMPYVRTLADPKPNSYGAKRGELYYFFAAQEFAGISPEMHEEFLLRYQMPIMEKFGLVAYGCCEDLTNKIDILRKIPNLQRIAVTPFADAERCAEQIGGDYVISYRPNPTLVRGEFDAEYIGKILKNDIEAFRRHGCVYDICLKDISTVGGDPGRLVKFTELSRRLADY